jgi:hypothetical protein
MPQERKHASNGARQAAYRIRREQAHKQQLEQRGLPALPAIPTLPGWPRWRAGLELSSQVSAGITQEMQSYYDARSATWQEGGRGEAFQEFLDTLAELNELYNRLEAL